MKRRLAGEMVDVPAALRPPRVTIAHAPTSAIDGSDAHLTLHVSSPTRVDTLRAFVEGRLVTSKQVCAASADLEIDVALLPGSNVVTLSGFDDKGFASNPAEVTLTRTKAASSARPELWIAAVGIDKYPSLPSNMQLEGAVADARAIASTFGALAGPGKPYSRAHTELLIDEAATVGAIRRVLGGLETMKPDDVAVVFLGGHGLKPSRDADMVFATGGVRATSSGARAAVLDQSSIRESTLGWSQMAALLARAPGRILLLLDACHSGHLTQDLVVRNDDLANALVEQHRAGAIVFAAARGWQLSYEENSGLGRGLVLDTETKPLVSAVGAHGFFTGALLKSIADPATDRNGDGAVQLSELIDDVTVRVSVATSGRQTPWVARRELFGDFGIAPATSR